jgi:hypothetical protein
MYVGSLRAVPGRLGMYTARQWREPYAVLTARTLCGLQRKRLGNWRDVSSSTLEEQNINYVAAETNNPSSLPAPRTQANWNNRNVLTTPQYNWSAQTPVTQSTPRAVRGPRNGVPISPGYAARNSSGSTDTSSQVSSLLAMGYTSDQINQMLAGGTLPTDTTSVTQSASSSSGVTGLLDSSILGIPIWMLGAGVVGVVLLTGRKK